MPHGAFISIGAFQLAANDVDAFAPAAAGKDRARDLLARGLLFLSAREWTRARDYFTRAAEAGLGGSAVSYLERIEIMELGEAEVRARKAWEKADGLFKAERWKPARAAYQAFSTEHAKSKCHARHEGELKERLSKIDSVLNPYQPGLLSSVYRGQAFEKGELLLRRIDKNVDFEWGGGSPDEKVPGNNFCIRWDGFIKIEKPGRYTFATLADDGTRLFLDGKLVFEDWRIHPPVRKAAEVELQAGLVPIRLEYFEAGGGANVKFFWGLKDGFKEVIVPEAVLFHKPLTRGSQP
jgi:hypothetical protein